MESINLPVELRQSYLSYSSYPLSLIRKGTKNYSSTLEAYKARLDIHERKLCLSGERFVDVRIKNLTQSSNPSSRR